MTWKLEALHLLKPRFGTNEFAQNNFYTEDFLPSELQGTVNCIFDKQKRFSRDDRASVI